ncbi:MAG: T9SS type A sorting domain-containing protein [Bacteroidota bacterium]|nr:MAG: T9SS type A sorting domain-containing protein [Bacteroidota bacterium]
MHVSIMNLQGQQIQEGLLEIHSGKQVENIALKNSQSGIYLLHLKNASFQTSLKFRCR